MNPLKSVNGTIILGFVTAAVIILLVGGTGLNVLSLVVWLHVFFWNHLDRIALLFQLRSGTRCG